MASGDSGMSLRHLSARGDATRLTILRSLLLITALFGLTFAPLNIIQQRPQLAAAELAMVAYSLFIYWRLKSGLRMRLATWAYLLPFFTVLMFALLTAANFAVFVWVLLIPALSHLLLGRRDGSIVAVVYSLLAVGIFFLRFGSSPSVAHVTAVADYMLCAVTLFVISFAHETSVERSERRLREVAELDSLTRLATRYRFRQLYEQAREQAGGASRHAALIVMDLDHFKAVNDSYGHDVGDVVLRTVAARLLHHCRPSDRLGRMGGEEIAALLFDVDRDEALQQAERLRACIARDPVDARGQQIAVTMSLGMVVFDLAAAPFETVFSRADALLYQAKRDGRDRVCV